MTLRMAVHRGFTAVELLAVITVIAVLSVLALPAFQAVRAKVHEAGCASNQRQIGLALQFYALDHEGEFPPTTHSTGGFRRDRSWIFQLAPYLGNMDKIRVCPADPPDRQQRILSMGATSYVLNDLVFDDYQFNAPKKIPRPSQTLLMSILTENRAPSTTRDHIHGGEWTSFIRALNDIEPDRHRTGSRAPDRARGSANYLFADGRVESIPSARLREIFAAGINPAAVPTE